MGRRRKGRWCLEGRKGKREKKGRNERKREGIKGKEERKVRREKGSKR